MFSLDDERFQVFGACSLLLLAKMTCMSLMTSRQRIKTGKFANKEDSYFGDKSTPANLKESLKANDEVERIRRAHMNDMENIYPFILIGFFYCLTDANSNTAKFHFITFLIARVLHSIVYINAIKQPARGICYFVGMLVNTSMIFQSIAHYM